MLFEISILLIGGFAAAFVAGAAGFGDALIASAFWLPFFAPAEVVPIAVACFFAMHVVMLVAMRKDLDFKYLWPFVICGAVGVPFGVQLLEMVEPDAFKIGAGVFLMIYGGVMLKLSGLPPFHRGGRVLDGAVGGVGGVLGGFAGLSGFIPGLWCAQRGWTRAEARGVTQPFIMTMHGMAFAWLALAGLVTQQTSMRIGIALPAVALGAWAGVKLYGHFDDRRFRQCVLIVLTLAGAILLFTTL